MQTHDLLSALKHAAAELGSCSQPGTPRDADGATAAAAATPSNAHLLLQISALHKAFLSLSEAFLQEMEQRQEDAQEQQRAVQATRRSSRHEAQQLAAAQGQQAHAHAVLAQRCTALEEEVARWGLGAACTTNCMGMRRQPRGSVTVPPCTTAP